MGGMGVDPIGVKSASEKYGIHLQAYSPLGNGESDLITGDLVTTIGAKYDKTGAQVALRWIQEDVDVFTFQLSAEDKASLDAATKPSGSPSFRCSKLAATTIPTHKLNNGVDFPMMSIGTWQYDIATAEQ